MPVARDLGSDLLHGSLIPRLPPAFRCLQYGKTGSGSLGTRLAAWYN